VILVWTSLPSGAFAAENQYTMTPVSADYSENCILVLDHTEKICVFSDDYCSDIFCFQQYYLRNSAYTSIQRLGLTCVWRLKVWKILTLVGGLCCVGFINPICVVAGVQRQALFIGPN
jgi:hypothetical protein